MKRGLFLLLSLLITTVTSGCQEIPKVSPLNMPNTLDISTENTSKETEESETLSEVPAAYTDILDTYYQILFTKEDVTSSSDYATAGLSESITSENPLEIIGYTFQDIDGNGIDELIISEVWDTNYQYIISMFTLENDAAVPILEGWGRNRYYILSNGLIYNSGSSGAAYSNYETFRLNGSNLEPVEFVFSSDEELQGSTGWFYNTTGIYDIKQADIIPVDSADQIIGTWESMTVKLDYTLFNEYTPSLDISQNTQT